MSLPVAILAGGLATRLRPLTAQVPKILLEIAGKPFALHQLEQLRRQGVTRVVYCLGHLGDQVVNCLGDGHRWGVHVEYVFDGPVLLGTGGALVQALPKLGEAFMVLYGDSYLECDFQSVEKAFRDSGKLGLMTVFPNGNRWDQSNVVFHNGRILAYDKQKRSPMMRHIDYGLGVLQGQALQGYPHNQALDLAKVYQDLLARGELAAVEIDQRFYEMGSPAGLEETRGRLAGEGLTQQREPSKD